MEDMQFKGKTTAEKEVPGMAYVPYQYFTTPYEPQKALQQGTIFPELDKPFTGRKGGVMK